MSKSVFEKRHGEEDALNDVSGVLDQFNLPPAFIEYVRKNKKNIQIALGVIVVLVVFFSLYGSYKEKKIDEGAQALSTALLEDGDAKIKALEQVMNDYSSTSSALWAELEVGHGKMKTGDFDAAAAIYEKIGEEVGEKDPLYTLTLFGAAQAKESSGDYDSALNYYEKIKVKPGYEGIGFAGVGRIHERKGEYQKALEIYELYLGELADFPANYPEKILVEEKIARIKSNI